MESLLQDLRYALRMLLKNPGFTTVAVLTLALGISGSTAIFSVVEAVLLRPLPYPQPERILAVYETSRKSGGEAAVSPANYLHWKSQQDVFSALAAYRSWPANLSDGSRPERVLGAMTTPSLFQVLGLKPLAGRALVAEDARPGCGRVVVLSSGLWKRRFGSDAAVVGREIRLNGASYTVVGVLPPTPSFYAELWVGCPWGVPTHPLLPGADPTGLRDRHYLDVLARLEPAVSLQQAAARLDTIARRLEKQYPDSNQDRSVELLSLREDTVGSLRPTLLMLLAAVGFVLLIACANVANLLLARSHAREQELSIRAAIGAGRGRIVRQLMTESVLLALLAGGVAVLLALWLTPLVLELCPADIQEMEGAAFGRTAVDLPLLAFTLALSGLTGIVFGLTPALRGTRLDLNQGLKEGGRGGGRSTGLRARSLLAAGEIALSLVLLVGAGLMVRSFSRLLEVRPGFDSERLLVFSITAPPTQTSERQVAEYEAIVERLRSLPGIVSAGAVSRLPLSGGNSSRSFEVPGSPSDHEADLRVATSGYFRSLEIPLLRGRDFSNHDHSKAPPVAIVNQALAYQVFAGEDPIGKHFAFDPEEPPIEIVGVVGDVRHLGLETAPRPEIYLPLAQSYWFTMTVAARSSGSDPLALVPSIQRAVWSFDPEMPLAGLQTMDRMVSDSLVRRRFAMLLLSVFAGEALLLAAIGLYGVIAYSVSQRTREFAIRMALGARSGQVVCMILREALLVALAGVAVGAVAALGLARLISGLLFGVAPTDPWTFGCIALLLAVVALLAAAAPARRATRVDPLVALRCE